MVANDQSDEKLTITVEEAGKRLGISRATAYALANQGQLPVIRLGKRLLVSKVGLERMVNEAGTKAQEKK